MDFAFSTSILAHIKASNHLAIIVLCKPAEQNCSVIIDDYYTINDTFVNNLYCEHYLLLQMKYLNIARSQLFFLLLKSKNLLFKSKNKLQYQSKLQVV